MKPTDLINWQQRMGISMRCAAKLLGVSYATYRDWYAGKSRTTGMPVSPPAMALYACAFLEQQYKFLGKWW